MCQKQVLVFQHSNTARLQCAPDSLAVVPPVMVAQNCDRPKRRLQAAEFIRNGLRGYKMPADHTLSDEVAEHDNQVRFFGVGDCDDLFQPGKAVVRRTDVQVSNHRDFETRMFRMPRPDDNCLVYYAQP